MTAVRIPDAIIEQFEQSLGELLALGVVGIAAKRLVLPSHR